MTVRELFDFIKGVRPGFAFNDAQMMVWLNEIEGKVQTDIMLLDPAVGEDGTVTGLVEYDVTTDMDTELIVPFPWNKLYRYFMLMSIDLYNGEYQRYGNTFAQFNEAYEEYAAWYAQNIAPANGLAVAHGYYLTAYQFAVRGGFPGTEEEFYETLGELRPSILKGAAATPERYGAVGDGVTDDTAALQAALDNNSYVYAKNTYKVSAIHVYKATLEIGGEIRGQVIIENYATVRGGKIKANATLPKSSCVKFENNMIDGYNYMGSTLEDCFLYSDNEAGNGIEIYTWSNIADKTAAEPEISRPIHGISCRNITIQYCERSIYFHNYQSWLTKSDFDNIACLFTSYPIYVENDRSKLTANITSVGMYSDITMRNVYAQYGSSKPVNFLRVEQGVIGLVMYDCFCYDYKGSCQYYINENGVNSSIRLLGEQMYAPTSETFTNQENHRSFIFHTGRKGQEKSVALRHAAKTDLPKSWMPVSEFESFTAYYGPNNTQGKRFCGIITRTGTRSGGGDEKRVSGLSWYNGHLRLLTNSNDEGIIHSYPDYLSHVIEVPTPAGGEVYDTYEDLPSDATNGATCWVRELKHTVVMFNGYWYKPNGSIYVGDPNNIPTFVDADDLQSKWNTARNAGKAIYKNASDNTVFVSFSKNFWYKPETSLTDNTFYYGYQVDHASELPGVSVNGTIYWCDDLGTCLCYVRRFWRYPDSESHVYYDPTHEAIDSASLPDDAADGTTYMCLYYTINTIGDDETITEEGPYDGPVVCQNHEWYTPGGSKINRVEDPRQNGYITDQFEFIQGRAINQSNGKSFVPTTHPEYYSASSRVDIGIYVKLRVTMPTGPSAANTLGYAFLNAKKQRIAGGTRPVASEEGTTTVELTVPTNAKYICTTYWSDEVIADRGYEAFSCYAIRFEDDEP